MNNLPYKLTHTQCDVLNTTAWGVLRSIRSKNHDYRYGQALFDTIADLYPELVESIRGTELDMYYLNDEKACMVLYTRLCEVEE